MYRRVDDLRSVQELEEIVYDAGVQLGGGALRELAGAQPSSGQLRELEFLARLELSSGVSGVTRESHGVARSPLTAFRFRRGSRAKRLDDTDFAL